MSSASQIMRSKYALQTPQLQQSIPDMDQFFSQNSHLFDASTALGCDVNFDGMAMTSYPPFTYDGGMQQSLQDFGAGVDPMSDVDFNKYVQVTT